MNAPLDEIVFASAKTRLPTGLVMVIETEPVRDEPPFTDPEMRPFCMFE